MILKFNNVLVLLEPKSFCTTRKATALEKCKSNLGVKIRKFTLLYKKTLIDLWGRFSK